MITIPEPTRPCVPPGIDRSSCCSFHSCMCLRGVVEVSTATPSLTRVANEMRVISVISKWSAAVHSVSILQSVEELVVIGNQISESHPNQNRERWQSGATLSYSLVIPTVHKTSARFQLEAGNTAGTAGSTAPRTKPSLTYPARQTLKDSVCVLAAKLVPQQANLQ